MTVTVFIEQKHIQISTNEDSKWKPPPPAAFNPFSCVNLLTGPLLFSSNEKEPGPKRGVVGGESLYHEYSNRLDLIRISLLLFFQRPSPPVHRWNVLDFGWVYSIRVDPKREKNVGLFKFFPSCSFISEMPLRQCSAFGLEH
jgi:hypothetical protein